MKPSDYNDIEMEENSANIDMSNPVDKLQSQLKDFSPIVQNVGKSLNVSINQLKKLILKLVDNGEALDNILLKKTLAEGDCEYIRETITELVEVIIEQKKSTDETVENLEDEKDKVSNITIQMNELKEEAYRDRFTGLYNRYKFDEIISGLNKKIESDPSQEYSFSFLEINNLAKINEKFGPDIGHEMMKVFSYILWNRLGKKGLNFHFHGNEFIVLMRTNKEYAKEYMKGVLEMFDILDELPAVLETTKERDKREGYDVFKDEMKTLQYTYSLMRDVYGIKLTFSCGIFDYKGAKPQEIIEYGQDLVYQAKNEGNSKIIIDLQK